MSITTKKYSTLIFSTFIILTSLASAFFSDEHVSAFTANTRCRTPRSQLAALPNQASKVYAIIGTPTGVTMTASQLGITAYYNSGLVQTTYSNGNFKGFELCNLEYTPASGGEIFQQTSTGWIKQDCLNLIRPINGGIPPTPPPPPPTCADCYNPDDPIPGPITNYRNAEYGIDKLVNSGYATATASAASRSTSGGTIKAQPNDRVIIDVHAQAAYYSAWVNNSNAQGAMIKTPYTNTSTATVTNDLPTANPKNMTANDGTKIESTTTTPLIVRAEHVGKTFTGIATATPTSANISFAALSNVSQIIGVNPGGKGRRFCPLANQYCEYNTWLPKTNTYMPGYSISANPGSGSARAEVKVEIDYSYEPCFDDPLTSDDECCLPGKICTPPPSEACDAGIPPRCRPSGHKYGGEDSDFSNTVTVKPIDNGNGLGSYATNSPPSIYEIITFVISPDAPTAAFPSGGGTGTTPYSGTINTDGTLQGGPARGTSCNYYTATIATQYVGRPGANKGCVVAQRQSGIYFNTYNNDDAAAGVNLKGVRSNSAYDVNGGSAVSLSPNLVVDDLPIGSKFCVALSVWPDRYTGLNANFTGGYWKHDAPKCYTIAKKPSVQFWGGGVYAAGGVETSQSVKHPGFVAIEGGNNGNNNPAFNNIPDANRLAFGSWSEYEIVSNGAVSGMASGAAFGYNPSRTTTSGGKLELTPNAHLVAPIPGGYPSSQSASRAFASDKACAYSSMTFSNSLDTPNNCNSDTIGSSQIDTNVDLTIERVVGRYATPITGALNTNPDSIDISTTTNNYVSQSTNVTLSPSGHTTIAPGNTVTVTVPGTLTIANNITYQNISYTDPALLPQLLIFADEIRIAPNVTQVDAWLIVGQHDPLGNNNTGVLNTCAISTGDVFTVGAATGNAGSADSGCDNQLTINGPVFAGELALNRVGGANPGNNSIDSAETFNLRSDSYLWAYGQAKKSSQAVVTYTRELAPRY